MSKIYKREKVTDELDRFCDFLLEFNHNGKIKYIQGNIHVASSFSNYTGFYLKEIKE